jgi:K+/H+ antiporter YhaU regulatory subunit KhtT
MSSRRRSAFCATRRIAAFATRSRKAASGRRLSALVAAGTSELFLVLPDAVPDGRLLSELDLAVAHVAVPAVLRDGVPLAPPPENLRLAAGDTLVLVGAHEDLARVLPRLEAPAAVPPVAG